MKERELNFTRTEDSTLVELSATNLAAFKKASNDLHFAMAHLSSELKDGKLEEGMKITLSSLIESHVHKLTESLGYEGHLKSEMDKRFKEIRELNDENRNLRKQLGEKVSMEDVREAIKNLSEAFKRWWNIEGFGHVSELHFGAYGLEVKLSGMITEAYYDKSDDKATELTKAEKLRGMGFDVTIGESRSDIKILGSDNNMKKLHELLKSNYPSAEILYSKSWHGRTNEATEIREVDIFIKDLNDFNPTI